MELSKYLFSSKLTPQLYGYSGEPQEWNRGRKIPNGIPSLNGNFLGLVQSCFSLASQGCFYIDEAALEPMFQSFVKPSKTQIREETYGVAGGPWQSLSLLLSLQLNRPVSSHVSHCPASTCAVVWFCSDRQKCVASFTLFTHFFPLFLLFG